MADALQLLMVGVVFFLMLGLGSTVTPSSVKSILANPKAPVIGFISQFGFMPLFAFALAKILNVTDAQGISMVLIGCTPGGSTSNLFTYYSRGDVSLSISMTVLSTLAAFAMMPLLLLIYTRTFTGEDVKIPYLSIFAGLLIVLVPVSMGMIVLAKKPDAAKKLEKGASGLGAVFIGAALIAGCVQNPSLFSSGYKLYLSSILMAPAGYLAGYGLAALGKLEPRKRRTIALETGIQNSTLTIAIIMLTFPGGDDAKDQLQKDVLAFALMYSLFLVVSGVIASLIFRKASEGEAAEEEAKEKEGKEKEGEDDNNL